MILLLVVLALLVLVGFLVTDVGLFLATPVLVNNLICSASDEVILPLSCLFSRIPHDL